jgi:hypothetical protein
LSPFLQSLLTAAITAPIAAWLTAQFALHRFYREKVWERKTAAYTAIFDALHDMRLWFVEHMNAYTNEAEMAEVDGRKLGEAYRDAKARLRRRLDTEMWLLPKECLERLKQLEEDLAVDQGGWFNHIDDGLFCTNSALEDLRLLVQQDLGLTPPAWRGSAERALNSVRVLGAKLPWKKP